MTMNFTEPTIHKGLKLSINLDSRYVNNKFSNVVNKDIYQFALLCLLYGGHNRTETKI